MIPNMTLIDYFAGQALQALLSDSKALRRKVKELGVDGVRRSVVQEAYRIAMAMDMEREALLAHADAKVEA